MKRPAVLLFTLFITFSANCVEATYIGSTPASEVVKSFLNIPLNDSIDFIRWRLTISDRHFSLRCNYGVGKPNTSGFVNDNKVFISGPVQKEFSITTFSTAIKNWILQL